MTQAANYQTAFPQGPITNTGLMISMEWQRAFLTIWNRTGGAPGIDMTYQVGQIDTAISTAQAAQKSAAQAESDAQAAGASAEAAETAAGKASAAASAAQASANQAEADAQSALKEATDVLIMTLLTSSAQAAKTAQSLDDAAIAAALGQIWPSQLLQSSQA